MWRPGSKMDIISEERFRELPKFTGSSTRMELSLEGTAKKKPWKPKGVCLAPLKNGKQQKTSWKMKQIVQDLLR